MIKKPIKNLNNAASTLMNILSKKRGEQSNNKEAWNNLDDDNNCEAATNKTNNIIEYDRNCVVDTNKGEKEGVRTLTMRGERKKTKNLTLTVFTTRNMNTRKLMGPLMVLIME